MTTTRSQIEPKSHPMILTGESIRAILENRKSQTRPIVKWPLKAGSRKPLIEVELASAQGLWRGGDGDGWNVFECPYGQPGDRLWIRETWAIIPDDGGTIIFRADDPEDNWKQEADVKWNSPLSLPREDARLWLEIISVRAERLQDITEADIIAEGITVNIAAQMTGIPWSSLPTLHHGFAQAWDFINGKRAQWESNPWVWVIEFKQSEAPHAN